MITNLKGEILKSIFNFYIENNLFAPLDLERIKFELRRLIVDNISFDFGLDIKENNTGGIDIKGWSTEFPEYTTIVSCSKESVKDI